MSNHKLKYTQVKTYREQQLLNQGNCCALCKQEITDDAVLDHDHKTGLVRQVLHRGCNSMLGKIENNMPRSRINVERLRAFAENLLDYIETQHTELVHPTHKPKRVKSK